MMTYRRSAYFAFVLTLGLILLALLAPSCGPASPAPQGGSPPAETATPTPTPSPAPAQPADTNGQPSKLGSALLARLDEYRSNLSRPPDSDQRRASPGSVGVIIRAKNQAACHEILTLLGNYVTSGRSCPHIYADVPPSLLVTLGQRADVAYVDAHPLPYPNLGADFNGLIIRYKAGLLPSEDTSPTFVRLVTIIDVEDGHAQYEAVERFLKGNGAVMAVTDALNDDVYKPYGMIVAYVPIRILAELHEMPGIYEFRAEAYPVPKKWRVTEGLSQPEPHSFLTPTSRTPAQSPTDQDGAGATGGPGGVLQNPANPAAVAHGAKPWNDAQVKGQSVKVGIIDVGFDGYASLVSNGQLPVPADHRCYEPMLSSCVLPGNLITDHGTAVAEAVIDVAPDADLYLAGPVYESHFLPAVKWLARTKEVDVIVQSRAWHYDGPGDGTAPPRPSPILQPIHDMIDDYDVLWVNSAGNETRHSWFSTSDQYTLSPTSAPGAFPRTDGFLNFNLGKGVNTAPGAASPAHCNRINLPANGFYFFHLRWADGAGWRRTPNTNLDLILTNTASIVPIRISAANGNKDKKYPVEALRVHTFPQASIANGLLDGERIASGDYCVRVDFKSGSEPDWIQLQAFGKTADGGSAGPLQYSTTGQSIVTPADSSHPNLLAVGAANIQTTPSQVPAAIAAYSSRGPLPGGSTVKPDIAGGDNAYSLALKRRFTGTSQAAPHVAGLAALFRQKFPGYPAELVAYFLKTNAVQQGAPDPNNEWGHGFAKLPTPNAKPVKPTGLAGAKGARRITLEWNDMQNVTGYVVEQWDGRYNNGAGRWRSLPFTETGPGYNKTYGYELTGSGAEVRNLIPGVRYFHRVRATNWTTDSAQSSAINTIADGDLPVPTGLRATAGDQSITLRWSAVSGATGYEVWQWDGRHNPPTFRKLPFRETGVNYSKNYSISIRGTRATVTNLVNGVAHTYLVVATNGSLRSAGAMLRNIRPKAPSGGDGEPARENPPGKIKRGEPEPPPALPTPTPGPPPAPATPSEDDGAQQAGPDGVLPAPGVASPLIYTPTREPPPELPPTP